MTALAVLAVVSAWSLGTLAVAAAWPRQRAWSADMAVILALGLGAGLGISSVTFFAASLAAERPLGVSVLLELGLAAGCGAIVWRRRRHAHAGERSGGDFWLTALLGTAFAQAALVAVVAAARAYQNQPYSNSDGWTIWLMRARLLFRGGEDWPARLQAPQIAWTHPDYPLLVPASIARAWAFVGSDAPFVSGLVSALFGVATVALLVAAVWRRRSGAVALAGGLLLLGTPFFVTFSSNQHADVPLGFYILATLVLIVLEAGEARSRGLAALAGAAAGMAAWTKNEGQMFVLVLGAAWMVVEAWRGSWRRIGAFAGGLAVALAPLAVFKLGLAPDNDLVASAPWERWRDVFDGERHALILSTLARDVRRFGEWSVLPFLVMLLPLIGRGGKRLDGREWLAPAVLGAMLAGYYAVYLLTHWDLGAHLDSSLVRLLLQLWPAGLFCWGLAVGSARDEALAAAPATSARRRVVGAAVLAANVIFAAGIVAAMERQLAGNELAAARLDGGEVRVRLGEGWFGRETHRGEVWAWAGGDAATLLVDLDGEASRRIALRCVVRGLGARVVTIRQGGRTLWEGAVDEVGSDVAIAELELQPGDNVIVFATDRPGVPESPAENARALTFAVYGPTIE